MTLHNNNKEILTFTALGGMGEIGLNCYLYGVHNQDSNNYILVDLGIGFKDNRVKSIDTFFPDITYIKERKQNLLGLVITHGHEDHIGAIVYLWKELEVPIYATAFCADLIRERLAETSFAKRVRIIEVITEQAVQIGQFRVTWYPMAHSIPEANALLIKTNTVKLVHSGDFKLDEGIIDTTAIAKVAAEFPKYLICDSTNVLEKDMLDVEKKLIPDLNTIIATAKSGKIFITLFSSNLYRLNNILEIARKNKRKVVFLGRSLGTYSAVGEKHNYIHLDNVIEAEDAINYKDNQLVFIATGSQGEDRSALYNILIAKTSKYKITEKDTIIFSSKVIPGNESRIARLYNAIAEIGATLYTSKDHHIHVSGHPNSGNLKTLYSLVNPEWIIPMHGEMMHLKGQKKLAESLGYKSLVLHCGEVLELTGDIPKIVEQIETGKLCYEGKRIVNISEEFFKIRNKIYYEGTAFVSIIIEHEKITDIAVDILGILNSIEIDIYKPILLNKIEDFVNSDEYLNLNNTQEKQEKLRILVRRFFKDSFAKKPIIVIHLAVL